MDGSSGGPSSLGRRTAALLVFVALVGLPAAALRIACVGNACQTPGAEAPADIPFCSLPQDLRTRLAAGFREERSPDVIAVTGDTQIRGADGLPDAAWPSAAAPEPRVPLVLWGEGIEAATLDPGVRLDAVAPSLAVAAGLERPHPEVRSGRPLAEVSEARPRLLLVLALTGVSGPDLSDPPEVIEEMMGTGAMTLEADPGSSPIDPAAILTTIGTGGLPRQHGVTGSLVRTDRGTLAEAWSEDAPGSIIATLGDDLDEALNDRPRIGLIAPSRTAMGLIGDNWYLDGDRDDLLLDHDPLSAAFRAYAGDPVGAAEWALRRGYGDDDITDLLAVSLEGSATKQLRRAASIVEAAEKATRGRLTVALAGTGDLGAGDRPAVSSEGVAAELEDALGGEVVEAIAPGGFYIDQGVLTELEITEAQVTKALARLEAPGGGPLFDDVFPALSVSLARYCS